jgi:sec-independent protein translocase protein TatA
MLDIFSGPHIIVLLIIVLLIFGPKNLPKLAQSLGQSVRELKRGFQGLGDDLKDEPKSTPGQQQASAGPVPGTHPQAPLFTQPGSTPAEPVDHPKAT